MFQKKSNKTKLIMTLYIRFLSCATDLGIGAKYQKAWYQNFENVISSPYDRNTFPGLIFSLFFFPHCRAFSSICLNHSFSSKPESAANHTTPKHISCVCATGFLYFCRANKLLSKRKTTNIDYACKKRTAQHR